MYFPYLRGRQFELIALREFSTERDQNFVIPIIEPVKESLRGLKIAFLRFIETEQPFAFILNPSVGEIKDYGNITEDVINELKDQQWIPAFIVKNENITWIKNLLEEYKLNRVLLICAESLDTTRREFMDFVQASPISYILTRENRTLKRSLKGSDKHLIRLDDCFIPQKRNKDYLKISEEKFSEEHMFYAEDGYYGFSDFTILPDEYSEGGTTPYAISIHLTYQKENAEIWIRHFTSESNDDQANIQGKFAEAAEKAIRFLKEKNIKTKASMELQNYFDNKKYPGLGMVKKISIKHHLELINTILK